MRGRPDAGPAPTGGRRQRPPRAHPGTPPGTLPPPREGDGGPPVITVVRFTADDIVEFATRDIDEALAAGRPSLTWVNVDRPRADAMRRLGERFDLHPLALEDAMSVPQRSKVERYEDHYFIVMRMLRRTLALEDEQVAIFFGREWVVTIQERPGDVFDGVRDAIRHDRGHVRRAGADYLAYLLVDALVDAYFPAIDQVSEAIEALQDEAIARPRPGTMWRIQSLRRDLIALRRAAWPVREEIAVLQRDETGLIAKDTQVFLRDAYDHAVQALDVIESLRETMASVTDLYLSVQNQRLNEVMKVLTVIATLFIPLTFIASIYGMNFEAIPELHWRLGYAWALGLMAVTAAGMILFFRRKGWW